MNEIDPRLILGAFIRAHRERLPAPAKAGDRRRTPGWRREELAEAAGMGVTWITWLEQGRSVSASPAALSRLSDALHLSPAERASLFDLAGRRDPVAPVSLTTDLPADILALPALFSVPSYLLDHVWTARAWNTAAVDLFTGWLDEGSERNILSFVFTSPIARTLITDWPERARRLTAEFRADYSRRPRDTAMQTLIDDLSEKSALFSRLWREQEVLHREGGEREFNHQRFLQTTLLVASHPECKLVCLTPIE